MFRVKEEPTASRSGATSSAHPVLQINKSSWCVDLSLKVRATRPIKHEWKLMEYLSSFVDFYEGSLALKDVIIAFYATIGVHITQTIKDRTTLGNSDFVYHSWFYEVVEIHYTKPTLKDLRANTTWHKMLGHFDDRIYIDFKIIMTPSKRTGTRFEKLYCRETGEESISSFEPIKSFFVLDGVTIQDDTIIF